MTQILIDQGFREELLTHGSTSRPREFVLALLNDQKLVLEGVFDFVRSEWNFSISCIKQLHTVLIRSQISTEAIDFLDHPVEVELIRGDWEKNKQTILFEMA